MCSIEERSCNKSMNVERDSSSDFNRISRSSVRHEQHVSSVQMRQRYPPDMQKRASRRRKVTATVALIQNLAKRKSASNLSSFDLEERGGNDVCINNDSNVLLHAPVELSTSLQTKSRYLILYPQELLFVKQRSLSLYRIKLKLNVRDLWIASCVEEVTEVPHSSERSLVIGWPVVNMVVTFLTTETMQQWKEQLSKCISEQKSEELPYSVSVKISCKNSAYSISKTLLVKNTEDTVCITKRCVEEFHIEDSSADEFQLWAIFENNMESPYPLIGHEYPYTIRMRYLRDIQARPLHDSIARLNDAEQHTDLYDPSNGVTFQMIYKDKNRRNLARKYSWDDSYKPSKSKSPITRFLKRASKRIKKENRLFGRELAELWNDGTFCEPLMRLLHHLYEHGPATVGIFRKSASIAQCREFKSRLDTDRELNLSSVSTLIVATILKEFLRCLPNCLLGCELYAEWIQVLSLKEVAGKISRIMSLLERLPICNQTLLLYIVCILLHINKQVAVNQMTLYNLSVCFSHCLLWASKSTGTQEDKDASGQIQDACNLNILILNFLESADVIFGFKVRHMFDSENLSAGKSSNEDRLRNDGLKKDIVHNTADGGAISQNPSEQDLTCDLKISASCPTTLLDADPVFNPNNSHSQLFIDQYDGGVHVDLEKNSERIVSSGKEILAFGSKDSYETVEFLDAGETYEEREIEGHSFISFSAPNTPRLGNNNTDSYSLTNPKGDTAFAVVGQNITPRSLRQKKYRSSAKFGFDSEREGYVMSQISEIEETMDELKEVRKQISSRSSDWRSLMTRSLASTDSLLDDMGESHQDWIGSTESVFEGIEAEELIENKESNFNATGQETKEDKALANESEYKLLDAKMKNEEIEDKDSNTDLKISTNEILEISQSENPEDKFKTSTREKQTEKFKSDQENDQNYKPVAGSSRQTAGAEISKFKVETAHETTPRSSAEAKSESINKPSKNEINIASNEGLLNCGRINANNMNTKQNNNLQEIVDSHSSVNLYTKDEENKRLNQIDNTTKREYEPSHKMNSGNLTIKHENLEANSEPIVAMKESFTGKLNTPNDDTVKPIISKNIHRNKSNSLEKKTVTIFEQASRVKRGKSKKSTSLKEKSVTLKNQSDVNRSHSDAAVIGKPLDSSTPISLDHKIIKWFENKENKYANYDSPVSKYECVSNQNSKFNSGRDGKIQSDNDEIVAVRVEKKSRRNFKENLTTFALVNSQNFKPAENNEKHCSIVRSKSDRIQRISVTNLPLIKSNKKEMLDDDDSRMVVLGRSKSDAYETVLRLIAVRDLENRKPNNKKDTTFALVAKKRNVRSSDVARNTAEEADYKKDEHYNTLDSKVDVTLKEIDSGYETLCSPQTFQFDLPDADAAFNYNPRLLQGSQYISQTMQPNTSKKIDSTFCITAADNRLSSSDVRARKLSKSLNKIETSGDKSKMSHNSEEESEQELSLYEIRNDESNSSTINMENHSTNSERDNIYSFKYPIPSENTPDSSEASGKSSKVKLKTVLLNSLNDGQLRVYYLTRGQALSPNRHTKRCECNICTQRKPGEYDNTPIRYGRSRYRNSYNYQTSQKYLTESKLGFNRGTNRSLSPCKPLVVVGKPMHDSQEVNYYGRNPSPSLLGRSSMQTGSQGNARKSQNDNLLNPLHYKNEPQYRGRSNESRFRRQSSNEPPQHRQKSQQQLDHNITQAGKFDSRTTGGYMKPLSQSVRGFEEFTLLPLTPMTKNRRSLLNLSNLG